MARSYANVATAIWRDDEFRALSVAGQHTYLLLISQPDISAAGVLSLSLRRWASRSRGTDLEALRTSLDELEERGFVVVDYDTEELLVRSFVRWDGGYTNSKRRFSIRDAAAQTESPALLSALAIEFKRLELPTEWVPSFPQVDSPSIGHTGIEDAASASRRVVVTEVSTNGPQPSTHTPHSTTRIPPPPAARANARKRGTRLPDDFEVTAEMVAWARVETPHVDGRYETAKFRDYWQAKAGRDATKVDWPSTWRNWMRKASERAGPPARATTDDRIAHALDLGRRMQAEVDAQTARKELGA